MSDEMERIRAAFARANKGAAHASAESAFSLNQETLGDESNQFGLAMYSQVRRFHGNIFFSPLSIRMALAMVYGGANTETAEQMRSVLRLPSAAGHAALGKIIERLHGVQGGRAGVTVANSLWAQAGETVLPAFRDLLARSYGAALNAVDFVRDAETVRVRINKWVEEQTGNRIRDLMAPGALDGVDELICALVLVSAVYFEGEWENQFDASATREEPFYTEGGAVSRVSLMNCQKPFWHLQANGYQAVDLAYDSDLSMLVLLPDRRAGLPDLEEALSVQMLNECTSAMKDTLVRLSLPRFRITWGALDVSADLVSLGMSLVFDRYRADLSGINGRRRPSDEGFFVGPVLHKSFVDVNEKGTEAAAATAVTVMVGASSGVARGPIPTFRADHPFLFAIRHRSSGSIVFLGRVADPSLES